MTPTTQGLLVLVVTLRDIETLSRVGAQSLRIYFTAQKPPVAVCIVSTCAVRDQSSPWSGTATPRQGSSG